HKSIGWIDNTILEAKINFTHFVRTLENLKPEPIPFVCHELLRRGAALQLAPNQPTYDHLIAYYTGNDDEPFDESNVGVILAQTKNRNEASIPDKIFQENFIKVNADGSESLPNETYKTSVRNGARPEEDFVFNE